jgi:hypothetical protein
MNELNIELTTEQIKTLTDSEFWDHYGMIAEAATQCPQSGIYRFDVTELRRFQNEAHRRLLESMALPKK